MYLHVPTMDVSLAAKYLPIVLPAFRIGWHQTSENVCRNDFFGLALDYQVAKVTYCMQALDLVNVSDIGVIIDAELAMKDHAP